MLPVEHMQLPYDLSASFSDGRDVKKQEWITCTHVSQRANVATLQMLVNVHSKEYDYVSSY